MMKKRIALILCLVLAVTMAVPVLAAGSKVYLTGSYCVGGTVSVDDAAILLDPSVTSEVYNAVLEGAVVYTWYRNNVYCASGKSYTFTAADAGCDFYCAAICYSNLDLNEPVATICSDTITVAAGAAPKITTTSLPNGTVGEDYYYKLDCTDPDATYSLFRSSLPDGLYITQHGEIEGTPTKAGFWYVVIMVEGVNGQSDTAEFEFYIDDAPEYSLEIMQLPNKLTYTAGEKLDMTGLKVRVWGNDGFFDSYNGDKLTYSQKELVTLGEQKIKLTYENAFEFFIVTVVAAPEETTEATSEATEETFEVVWATLPNGEGGESGVITVGPMTGTTLPATAAPEVGHGGLLGLSWIGILTILLVALIGLVVVLLPILLIILIIVLIVRSKKKKAALAAETAPLAEEIPENQE